MLEVLVNNEVLDFQIENEKTIGEVLGEVESFCNQNGHAVFKVVVDKTEVSAEKLDEVFALPLTSSLRLELFTKSASEIRANICELARCFETFAKDLTEVSVKMQTGEDSFVLELLSSISYTCKDLFSFLSLSTVSNISPETIVNGKTILETQKAIGDFLKDITTAFEEKDIVSVSDLSEYELAPLLDSFAKALVLTCK